MSDSLQLERITSLVKEDPTLSVFLDALPQAVIMPFAKDEAKHFLTIVLFIIEQALNREVLAALCCRVVEVLNAGNVISDLEGLEIMPCIVNQGKTRRILRLSILSHAIGRAERLSSADLSLAQPAQGITCHLYEKNIP
jgi:hypothetical protein